jgi:Mg-chelatase subunit ChlD
MNTNDNNFQTPMNIGTISTPKSFDQLGIFIPDGSGSMFDQTVGGIRKADAVNDALRGVFSRFKASRYANNFTFAVVPFDTHATLLTPPTSATVIDDNGNYDPTNGHGNGTFIGCGLKLAEQLANDFLKFNQGEGLAQSVVIVVMSDGMCGEPDKTKQIASRIKQNSKLTICSTLFSAVGANNSEMNAAEQLLRDIATDPSIGYQTTYDPETLRKFFIKSMSASSGVKIN